LQPLAAADFRYRYHRCTQQERHNDPSHPAGHGNSSTPPQAAQPIYLQTRSDSDESPSVAGPARDGQRFGRQHLHRLRDHQPAFGFRVDNDLFGGAVEKRPMVGSYGVALLGGKWKFALGRCHRPRAFEGQQKTPVFDSFTPSRTL